MQAYRATVYEVALPDQLISLFIDRFNQSLYKFYQSAKIDQMAIITAYNPRSEICLDSINQKNQKNLNQTLRSKNYSFFNGKNIDPSHQWIDEPSFCVVNISNIAAQQLARQYHQNAIVFIKSDAIPRIICC